VIAVADWLVQEHSLALAKKTDEAAFNGDGTSTFGGIQGITTKIDDGTHTAGVVAAAAGNNSFENLDLADFSKGPWCSASLRSRWCGLVHLAGWLPRKH
jgi:hypothetical protein